MEALNLRITHRAAQDCNPAETIIEIGKAADPALFPGDMEAFAAGQCVGADLILEANALEAAPALEWSTTLCNAERVNHAAAEKACAALGEGWRLPTRVELLSLVDDTRSDPAIDTARFPDTKSGAYWTSTVHASVSSCAWFVDFLDGGAYNYRRDYDNAFVRAVRASPAGQ